VPTIGLSMIVKNEAHTIRACLESARELVSQIVIADTGSTDNTCDIARELGATIVAFPWEHHYANARNAALKPVTTDWVLVLDADEELDGQSAKSIQTSLQNRAIGGFSTPIRNYVKARSNRGWDRIAVENDFRHERAKSAPAYFVHENCRFFRRHPGIFFTGRVHELVEPQIAAVGLKLGKANFCIHHFGHLESNGRNASKGTYYRDLLRRKVEEEPNDPAGWVHLALQEYEHFHNQTEALGCLQRALQLEPRAAEAWLFLAMIYVDAGMFQEALAALERDTRKHAGAGLREQVRGDALHSLNRLEEARAAYRRAIKLAGRNPVLESKLGYVEVKLGYCDSGLAKLVHAANEDPAMFAAQDRLMKAYMVVGKLHEAAITAETAAQALKHPRTYMRAASLYAALHDSERCIEILRQGLAEFPASPDLQQALTEANRGKAASGPFSSSSNAAKASAP